MPAETNGRRRLAFLDGGVRHDVAATPGSTVEDVLDSLGMLASLDGRVLVNNQGEQIDLGTRASGLNDGAVLAVVVPVEAAAAAPKREASGDSRDGGAAWWFLGVAGVLATVLGLDGGALDPGLRWPMGVFLTVLAVAAAAAWALRHPARPAMGIASFAGPSSLAFAAGVLLAPVPAGAAGQLPVIAGLVCASALTGLAGYISRNPVLRAELGVALAVLLVACTIWSATLFLGMNSTDAAVLCLAAVPVALRALPTFLMDVREGLLLEYDRFQLLRWTVREAIPEPATPLTRKDVNGVIERSRAQLVTAGVVISLAAMVCAPFALGDAGPGDGTLLEDIGRKVLVFAVVAVLLLSARRASSAPMRWMPRIAGAWTAVFGLAAFLDGSDAGTTILVSLLIMLCGWGVVALLVPIGRGLRSLFWSRAADIVESIAVAAAFPAGLLAAGTVDLVRGMMA